MIRGHFKAGYKQFGFQNSTHMKSSLKVTLTYMDICIRAYKTMRSFFILPSNMPLARVVYF